MAGRVRAILDASKPSSPVSVATSRTALLLMDFQNFTVSQIPEKDKHIVTVASKLRDWALEKNMPVFHCVVDTKSGTEPRPTSRMSERWGNYKEKLSTMPQLGDEPLEISSTSATDLEGVFSRRPGLVSSLSSDGIGEALKQKQISSLILTGISTSGCVLSTCRDATEAGYVVTVVEDACSDPLPDLHDALMAHVVPATAHVVKAEDLKAAFANGS